MFWHLRTGIDMVESGAIPRSDPYSFTAAGDAWVVQSWLVEASYGAVHRLFGARGLRVEHGLLYAALAWTMASLSRTGTAWRTALAASLATGLGATYWSSRPLAVGLVCMALTVAFVERRVAPWLLVPIVWIWGNSHGSFVLGLGWLCLVAIGQMLDSRGRVGGWQRPSASPWLGAFAAGVVLASLNPLGPRLLAFPVAALSKREAFRLVVEWQPPSFTARTGVLVLLCLVGTIAVFARTARRALWSDLVPLSGFLALGLMAQRNLPLAAIAAAPALARALSAPNTSVEIPADRPPMHTAMAASLAALALVFVVVAWVEEPLDLDGYPVGVAGALPLDARVVTTDTAAGYLILEKAGGVKVFVDDRVDLYPVRVTRDYVRLLHGRPGALALLDRYGADAVLWPVDGSLIAQLAASDDWRRVAKRDGWVIYLRG